MLKEENKQLELFEDIKNAVWRDEKQQLGKLWERLWHFHIWCFQQKDENNKLKVFVKRDLYFDDEKDKNIHHKVVIKLRPQTIIDDDEVKQSYLSKDESDVFDYIVFKLSQGNAQIINQKTCLVLSMNEIRTKLKMDLKRIKKSIILLNDYNIQFEVPEDNNGLGSIPSALFNGVYIGGVGRRKSDDQKTYIYISDSLLQFIANNKTRLINYENMFGLGRISKIFYKRICFSNVMDKTSTTKQVVKMADKETICSLLARYSIQYYNSQQKRRLFKEIEKALEELKENKIISHYEYEDIKLKYNQISDFKIVFYITKEFSHKFSAYQVLKPRFENEVMMKDLERRKKANLLYKNDAI